MNNDDNLKKVLKRLKIGYAMNAYSLDEKKPGSSEILSNIDAETAKEVAKSIDGTEIFSSKTPITKASKSISLLTKIRKFGLVRLVSITTKFIFVASVIKPILIVLALIAAIAVGGVYTVRTIKSELPEELCTVYEYFLGHQEYAICEKLWSTKRKNGEQIGSPVTKPTDN